jgi:S-adenosylmethionine synthetase
VQLAYAIGVAEPLAVYVNTFGTGAISDDRLRRIVTKLFDFTPRGMIERLDLLRPIYKETARFGHFGRALPGFTWERTDRVDDLRKAAGL